MRTSRLHARCGNGSKRFVQTLAVVMALFLGVYGLNAQTTYTVGTGTGTNGSIEYPSGYATYYAGAKQQYLILASELGGAAAGDITALAFDVSALRNVDDLVDYTIRLKNTTATDLTAFESGTTTVFSDESYSVQTGWNTHNFDTPFFWDGTSNIIVETCFNNFTWQSPEDNSATRWTQTPFNSAVWYRNDEEANLCNTNQVYDYGTFRPNMQITITPPTPMSYVGSTTYQLTTNPPPYTIRRGANDAPVIVVELAMDGSGSPLSATNFTFNTNGSTNTGDLENARLFYTGGSITYSTAMPFGSIVANPNGTFSINGSQTLQNGSNFFWLAYDVADNAGVLNLLDGECTSFTVSGTSYTPAVTAPAGAAVVGLIYCQSFATFIADTYIGRVALTDMDNSSPVSEAIDGATYSNYTGVTPANIRQDETHQMLIEKATNGDVYDAQINVFIDFNKDEDYFDANERVLTAFVSDFNAPIDIIRNITIPGDAELGVTGMRVSLNETGGSFDSPCEIFNWGEVEDYLVNILPAFPNLLIVGNTDIGNVGSERRVALQLQNSSEHLPLSVSNWTLSNPNYKLYLAGTNNPVPSNFVLAPEASMDVELAFGTPGETSPGIQNGTLTFTHDGKNNPTSAPVSGNYVALGAWYDGNSLLAPGAALDIGGVEIGAPPITKNFALGPDVGPLTAPINVTNFEVIGPDAVLFDVSAIPPGLFNNATVSVSLNSAGAAPGPKEATLRIFHSASNGPSTDIKLEGKVGQPVIGAPSLVQVPPVALGQTYGGAYENIGFIPLTRPGAVDVEFYQVPNLTGSGRNSFELISNGGHFFLKGQFDGSGQVVVGGNGDIAHPANWENPSPVNPVTVTETQPWLLVVRMKEPGQNGIPGAYNADMLLSDASGNGVSNAVNYRQVSLIGEVLNDPTILPLYPTSVAFGNVAVGTTVTRTLTIRNQSGVAKMTQLQLVGSGYHFMHGGQSMSVHVPADNAPVLVSLQFSPMLAGPANGTLNASGISADGGDAVAPLSGTGLAASAGAITILSDGQALPPNNIAEFGKVAVGNVRTKTITVVNNNLGPVTLNLISRSGQNPTQFSTGMPMPSATIPGNGGSVDFDLSFAPSSTSNPEKTVTITVFNSTSVPVTFNARGTAVLETGDEIDVKFDPASYNFGSSAGCHNFTLLNDGDNTVTVDAALVLGSSNFSIDDSPASFPRAVSAGGSTVITVCFDNSTGTNGNRAATLLAVVQGVSPFPTANLSGTVLGAYRGGGSDIDNAAGSPIVSPLNVNGVYPNPASNEAELRLNLDRSLSALAVQVTDLYGRSVLKLKLGELAAGEHALTLDVSALSSGNYYVSVEAEGYRQSANLVILK